MGVIRTGVWTLAAVGLGIALATVEVSGRTPLQRARAAWRSSELPDWIQDRTDEVMDRARGALGRSQRPRERHSDEDRAALDRIIANRSSR